MTKSDSYTTLRAIDLGIVRRGRLGNSTIKGLSISQVAYQVVAHPGFVSKKRLPLGRGCQPIAVKVEKYRFVVQYSAMTE